jgi:hypothetical protein
MNDTYERLRKTIEAGVEAAEELRRLIGQQERPELRLIQGGVS